MPFIHQQMFFVAVQETQNCFKDIRYCWLVWVMDSVFSQKLRLFASFFVVVYPVTPLQPYGALLADIKDGPRTHKF